MIGELCAAIVTDLNGATFSRAFSARRAWLPRVEVVEMTAGEVVALMVPRHADTSPFTRGEVTHNVHFDLALFCKLPEPGPDAPEEQPADDPLLDELFDFCLEVVEWFYGKRPTSYPTAYVASAGINPDLMELYDRLLEETRVFVRVVALRYEVEEGA